MDENLKIKLYACTLDCPDPYALAKFYAALLDWEVVYHDDEYACAAPKATAQGGYPGLTFQRNDDFVSPVWPEKAGAQQQMAHLDFAVNDVEKAVEHAKSCGAVAAGEQFSEGWTVMLDPAGHPFCLCGMKEMMAAPTFALK